MKNFLSLIMMAYVGLAHAAPVTVTLLAGGSAASFYHDGGVLPIESGSYAELIVSQNSVYTLENAASWTVLTTISQSTPDSYVLNHANVGYLATGTAWNPGMIGIKWQNANYDSSYYVAIRFYDDADKGAADFYGVTTAQQLNAPSGTPTFQNISWNTSTGGNHFEADMPIPEPTTITLFGLSGLLVVLRRKMQKSA